jgi:hypothetical protein
MAPLVRRNFAQSNMVGRGDSINAAVAAGILSLELFNQRRALQGGYVEAGSVHAG